VPYERMDPVERAQEALEYSAQEVVEILAALDAAEVRRAFGLIAA
jgi:hypothetical protein